MSMKYAPKFYPIGKKEEEERNTLHINLASTN
jgi:hypothetical protein